MKIHNVATKYKTLHRDRRQFTLGTKLMPGDTEAYKAWKAHYYPELSDSAVVKMMLECFLTELMPLPAANEPAE